LPNLVVRLLSRRRLDEIRLLDYRYLLIFEMTLTVVLRKCLVVR
jgi:hypothetical protein